jgi:hypothetical protein
MDALGPIDFAFAEDAYCEARARRYVGESRARTVCDYELEIWIKAERAAAREDLQTRMACIRALLAHLAASAEAVTSRLEEALATKAEPPSFTAADVPQLVAKARTAFGFWVGYVSQEMYGEFLREGMDAMDFDAIDTAMRDLNEALTPFDPALDGA